MKTDLQNKCKNLKRQIELINYYYPNKKNNSFCQKLKKDLEYNEFLLSLKTFINKH